MRRLPRRDDVIEFPLKLPREVVDRILHLSRVTKSSSPAYLVARAIRLYDLAAPEVLAGRARLVLDFGGRTEEIAVEKD